MQTLKSDDADIQERWCGHSGTMMRNFRNGDADIQKENNDKCYQNDVERLQGAGRVELRAFMIYYKID